MKTKKLFPIFIAVSAVIILVGIILMAVLGFNTSAEKSESKTFEVTYDVVVEISEKEKALAKVCEDAFTANGIKYSDKATIEASLTMETVLRYTFKSSVSDEALAAAKAAVEAAKTSEDFANASIAVAVHTLSNETYHTAVWRGGVAIAVGAVVALIYVGARFGVGAALTGLTACANDVLLTLSLVAILRIPVTAAAPLLYGAIAAFLSIVFWMIRAAKLREYKKDAAMQTLSAEEVIEASGKSTFMATIFAAGAVVLVLLLIGIIATSGVRLLALPALIAVAAALYSSLLFAPLLHVYVKTAFDKFTVKQKRYIGKKKAEKTEKPAE